MPASPESSGYSTVPPPSTPTSRPCCRHTALPARVAVPLYVPRRCLTHPWGLSEPPASGGALRVNGETSPTGPTGDTRRRHRARAPDVQYPLPDIREKFSTRKISAAAAARGGGKGKGGGSGKGGGRDEDGLRGTRVAVGPPAGSFSSHAKPVGTDADCGRQSGRGLPMAELGSPADGVDRPDIRRRREHYSAAGSRRERVDMPYLLAGLCRGSGPDAAKVLGRFCARAAACREVRG